MAIGPCWHGSVSCLPVPSCLPCHARCVLRAR
jgi:hypothetical protein